MVEKLPLSGVIGKDVYTINANYVGKVKDVQLDIEKGHIYGLVIQLSSDSIVYRRILELMKESADPEKAKVLLVPFSEVSALGDVVLIRIPRKYEEAEEF